MTNKHKFIKFINYLLSFNSQYETLIKNGIARFNIIADIMIKMANDVSKILIKESNLLKLQAPIYIYGDIHGQYQDLLRFLEMTKLPPESKLLFLGDYVDRGKNSIEVIALIFALKIVYPSHIFLLRGNHECPEINFNYGFYGECIDRYGKYDGNHVFEAINNCLLHLPIAAVINDKIFCVHGGLSPNMTKLEDINKINRNMIIPSYGLLCDLLWSDPKSSNIMWSSNDRGISYTFNEQVINIFMEINNLELICRAHQANSTGYKFFNGNKLITLFSAPNYCGTYGNQGAVMHINHKLECSFLIIQPHIST